MSHHDEKIVSRLVQLAATYIAREAGRKTLITPTRAMVSSDGSNATVYVSVFPDADAPHAMEFLARHAHDFRDYLRKESRIARLPRVRFEHDLGEMHRQHLDDLSREI
jgi:ribosome-binding factor A